MEALAIVPDLNVLENGGSGLGMGGKRMSDTFGLEGSDKALHRCVIVAVSCAAHTDQDVMLGQVSLDQVTGVLAALVRVVEQAGGGQEAQAPSAPSSMSR